ncbi:MAG TPA: fluoride efflux transporter CrcB [Acidimicrobiia bacterium]|jgi:CrcB protein
MLPVLIALAGGGGAVARFVLDGVVQDRTDSPAPLGTFVINVSGSFLLGVIAGLTIGHTLSANAKLIAGTGFLGGYTTFSTYALETYRLVEDRAHALAAANLLGSIAAGLAAAALGLLLTGAL